MTDGRTHRRPIRVLMLIDFLHDTGGAERLAMGLATHLPPEGCEVSVCTTRRAQGKLTTLLDAAGIPHFSLERGTGRSVLAFRRLISFLRRERIDVIHAHKSGSAAWGAVCGRIARVPVIVAHEHGSEDAPLRRFVNGRVTGRLVDAFVVGSSADRERMIDSAKVPAEKVVLVPGAYIPKPDERKRDFRRELGIPADAPLVGTVAVLRPEKALSVLIDAFARVAGRMPDARLVIFGEGAGRPELEQQAVALGLGEKVLLPGPRRDIGSILDAIDVAAISSDREGTSLFALECMAHSTPLVSTDVGGPHDIFESGVSALLVPPRDPEALGDAIEALLVDEDGRRRLAEAAHRLAGEFTIERAASRFADLYEQLLAQASSRRGSDDLSS